MTNQSEMSKYIDIDKYNRYEEGHPGYGEMMNTVLNQTIGTFGGKIGKILEIGAGTGNYTRRIGETHTAHIDAIEIDSGCNDYLKHKMDSGEIQNTHLMTDDFLRWATDRDNGYNAVNTTFADHHFSPEQKPKFLERISALLKPNGEYVLGDEFLPPHNESDPAERVSAQIQYHGMVIEEAFKEGKVELPKLELDALISGLHTTVRFIQQTVPEKRSENFQIPEGDNPYNKAGLDELNGLIARLQKITTQPLENPEQLPPEQLLEKRHAFIEKLRTLATEMRASRQPGLEEDSSRGVVGGDYKMTVRQYVKYLDRAGFKAVGYFEGPKPVGGIHDSLDEGTGMKPIALNGQDHAGGVWVIRALKQQASRDNPVVRQ